MPRLLSPLSPIRAGRLRFGGLLLLLLAGCDRYYDQIEKRTVDRPDEPEKTRLLGVILPHGDKTWFLKVTGPVSGYDDAQIKEFNDFVQSIRFPEKGDSPITWTIPEGWRHEDGPKPRYATMVFGSKDKPLQLIVAVLGKEAAAVRPNVDRWRGQLGLAPATDAEMAQTTENRKTTAGYDYTFVNLTGAERKAKANGPPWHYEKPDGWTEQPHPELGALPREAVFQAGEGDQKVEISVTALGGPAGGLLANVNRWCRQVQRDEFADEAALKKVPTIPVSGADAPYFDLTGPKGRILGVVVARADRTWFFKLGPAAADAAAKQKDAFEAFVKSVRFDGD